MSVAEAVSSRSPRDLTLKQLIEFAHKHGASDVFIKAGSPPGVKKLGKVLPAPFPVLDEENSARLAMERMTPEQKAEFKANLELNLSFTLPGLARIRQNVYRERQSVASTCRLITLGVRSLAEIGVELPSVKHLTTEHDGLVLVTGPTGSGKSTTLAAMIDHINASRNVNIITIEDPIEYVYSDKQSRISQREVGIDTKSFDEALKQVLRQTPDVILIGELRDLTAVNVALQAAETGHLVFATLHTSGAVETLDRLANMFPPAERSLLALRMGAMLRGVISQRLCRRRDNSGYVVAQEVMRVSPTISKQIADSRSDDIYNQMRIDGQEGYWGMQTMNQSLERLVAGSIIDEADAMLHAGNAAEMKQMLRRRLVATTWSAVEGPQLPGISKPVHGQSRDGAGGDLTGDAGGAKEGLEDLFVLRRS